MKIQRQWLGDLPIFSHLVNVELVLECSLFLVGDFISFICSLFHSLSHVLILYWEATEQKKQEFGGQTDFGLKLDDIPYYSCVILAMYLISEHQLPVCSIRKYYDL